MILKTSDFNFIGCTGSELKMSWRQKVAAWFSVGCDRDLEKHIGYFLGSGLWLLRKVCSLYPHMKAQSLRTGDIVDHIQKQDRKAESQIHG